MAVTGEGADWDRLPPMTGQLRERHGRVPVESLAGGGFARLESLEAATALGTEVHAPVRDPKDPKRDPYRPCATDSPASAEWRSRMGAALAKTIHRQRAATAACVNAQVRGPRQFLVRGIEKARAVVPWHALAHNLMRAPRFIAPRLAA